MRAGRVATIVEYGLNFAELAAAPDSRQVRPRVRSRTNSRLRSGLGSCNRGVFVHGDVLNDQGRRRPYLDEHRRRAAHPAERLRATSISRSYGREHHVHVRQARHLSLHVFHSSANDRDRCCRIGIACGSIEVKKPGSSVKIGSALMGSAARNGSSDPAAALCCNPQPQLSLIPAGQVMVSSAWRRVGPATPLRPLPACRNWTRRSGRLPWSLSAPDPFAYMRQATPQRRQHTGLGRTRIAPRSSY